MNKRKIGTALNWLLTFIHVQLFISLISLPLLIGWGLPFSLLAPIGNLIFIPFIMTFLLLSSCLFFSEILNVPNKLCIISLEYVYNLWQKILENIPFYPLVGFKKPHPAILIFLPIVTIILLNIPHLRSRVRSIMSLIALFICIFSYLNYAQPTKQKSLLTCNRGNIILLYNNGHVTLIDPGYIGQTKSARSWLAYTLMPHIIGTWGKTTIDHAILLSPTITTLASLKSFINEYNVGTLYLPNLGDKSNHELSSLKRACKKNKCLLKEVGNEPIFVTTGNSSFTIKPLPCLKKKSAFKYHPLSVKYKKDGENDEFLPNVKCYRQKKSTKCVLNELKL